MRTWLKKGGFYVTASVLFIWILNLNETVGNLIGTGLMILFLWNAIPFLIVNVRMWYSQHNDKVTLEQPLLKPKTKRLFYLLGLIVLMASLISEAINTLLIVAMFPAVMLLISVIFRGEVWEEVEEYEFATSSVSQTKSSMERRMYTFPLEGTAVKTIAQ